MTTAQTPKTEERDGLAIVHIALYRMGTRSMTEAYKILGYKAHHVLDTGFLAQPWDVAEQAAEATWPGVMGAQPRPPFKRENWERLWDPKYEVVTDLVSPFSDQLPAIYPNAKVVVVQRDFESWWPSYKSQCLDAVFTPFHRAIIFLMWHIMGLRNGFALQKIHLGFFDVKNAAEIEANARRCYERFFDRVRETIPPERRLDYKIGDEWEPLCAFLGKEVPDVPFPRLNDGAALTKVIEGTVRTVLVATAKKIASWALIVAVISAVIQYVYG